MIATILSMQAGQPVEFSTSSPVDGRAQNWVSGIRKLPVQGRAWCGRANLAGDGQANLQVHGGPDKAVYGYPSEHYPLWQAELGLESLPAAAFGENLTTQGLLESEVCIGDTFRAGEVVLQVSQPRGPCWKLARYLGVPDMMARMNANGRVGFYLRVLQEGWLEAGQALTLLDRPNPRFSVQRAHFLLEDPAGDLDGARELARLPEFAERSRAELMRKLE